MGPTILDILRESEERLHGVDSPRLSAELLIAEVLQCSRLMLTLDRERRPSVDEIRRISDLVERRSHGEPLAYILGTKEFYGLDFVVTPDVLIPRPETEHIVEVIEEAYSKEDVFHFADFGTGSGILAVTITSLFPKASAVAVDLSPGALKIAQSNARTLGVSDRIEFIEGDFTQPLLEDSGCDFIVSNPPYVTEQEYAEASHEVTEYEPVTALVSGADGLDHIRAMLPLVAQALKPGGRFLVEMGYQQGAQVIKIITNEFPQFKDVRIKKDLAGHDRIVMMEKL